MGCKCEGTPGCDCGEQPAAVDSIGHPAGDLMSGGTGMSMRRFKTDRTLPGGLEQWGSTPRWVGFRRPLQDLDRSWSRVQNEAPLVGYHVQRVTVDTDTGTAVSLMGEPTADCTLFPEEPNPAGYLVRATSL